MRSCGTSSTLRKKDRRDGETVPSISRRLLPAAGLADRSSETDDGNAPRPPGRGTGGVSEEWLEQAQDDATILAIRDQERAGLDIITDGEMRRESYSNRFATALAGVDIDNPGTAVDRSCPPN